MPDEKRVPGVLGADAGIQPVCGARAGVEVLHEQLAPLGMGAEIGPQEIELLRAHRLIVVPPDRLLGGAVAHNELVLHGPAGVDARLRAEGTGRTQASLAARQSELDELGVAGIALGLGEKGRGRSICLHVSAAAADRERETPAMPAWRRQSPDSSSRCGKSGGGNLHKSAPLCESTRTRGSVCPKPPKILFIQAASQPEARQTPQRFCCAAAKKPANLPLLALRHRARAVLSSQRPNGSNVAAFQRRGEAKECACRGKIHAATMLFQGGCCMRSVAIAAADA